MFVRVGERPARRERLVSTIDPTSGGAGAEPSASRFNEMTSEDFAKIIFAELSNQDPLQPNDSKALLEQLSSIRSIQSDMDLSTRLQSLVAQNEMSSAAGLIGKFVSGVSDENLRVAELVVSVSRTKDGAVLNLHGGHRVKMKNVDEVLDLGGAGDAARGAA